MRGTLILAAGRPQTPRQTGLAEYDIRIAHTDEEVAAHTETCVPEAIILDLSATSIDLPALCHALRRRPLTRTIPIIALTPPASRASARAAGADVCLSHPLDEEEIRQYLQAQRQSTTLDGLRQLLDGVSSEDAEGLMHLLAHDIKGPGSAAVSVLSMLVDVPDITDPIIIQNLRYALSSAQRQFHVLDEMLDLFCLLNGLFPLDIQAVDVAEVVQRVLSAGKTALARKDIRVTSRIPATLPAAAADANLLRQTLSTLLSNSLKFCIQGDTLTIDAQADHARLVLAFTDTGRAILPDCADALFDLRLQWSARKRGSRTSVACGLPFCRAALRAMQGTVRARSNADGSHTTFALTLPVYKHIAPDRAARQARTHDEGNHD